MKFADFINSKKEMKIGFLGGSITFGAGASAGTNCYRGRVMNALREKYPEISFSDINAAIGGTCSDFGLFRMEKQLLSENPDMVFVEFAVNDYGLEKSDLYMENIVRNILAKNPNMPIVFLYSVSDGLARHGYDEGKLPQSVQLHQKVADYYNIPSINMGKALYDRYMAENEEIIRYLPDKVHPNDDGHKVYADFIMENLENMEFDIKISDTYLTEEVKNPTLVFPTEQGNWKMSNFKTYGLNEPYAYSNTAGDCYRFEFVDSIVGVAFMMEKDSGIFSYSIDGVEMGTFSTYDVFCDRFARTAYKILADNLEYKNHTLEIKVTGDKHENSEGTYVRISAFMHGEQGA